jgi:carbamoyltransferase
MLIAGINDGHNASVVLLRDGRIVFAWQEERITRRKNQSGFPIHALREGLRFVGAELGQVDVFAVASTRPVTMPSTSEEDVSGYSQRDGSFASRLRSRIRSTPLAAPVYGYRQMRRRKDIARLGIPPARTRFYDHHLCHAATAFWGSGRTGHRSLILTNDGAGDGLCGSVYVGENGALRRLSTLPEADSIGMLYTTATVLLGMLPNEHEYKVMGLAPYGAGRQAKAMTRELLAWVSTNGSPRLTYGRTASAPSFFRCYRELARLFECRRFDHISAAVQQFLEEVLVRWVTNCIQVTQIPHVMLSGGVFLNVKANQKILELPCVRSLYVVPSCGDETNAFGAAFLAHVEASKEACEGFGPLYYGPKIEDADVDKAIGESAGACELRISTPPDIVRATAELLSQGHIVARVWGREEFGARALGNRSILADPSAPGVVQTINRAIKQRDFWMPFACSVLAEEESRYIRNPKGMPAPYMIVTFDCTENWRQIAAGIHPHDYTVRPQVVGRKTNPEYHRLLSTFRELTGRGAVLNTSYNLHGEPLVSSARDAVDVFARSGLRWLALGNRLLAKA